MKELYDEENICVFVANLPATLSNSELAERLKSALKHFGNILSVKTSRDHKNRPYAFVQFEGPVYDFMLTEMIMIEDRVLRFERAKRPQAGNSGHLGYDLTGVVSAPAGFEPHNGTLYITPQGYVPYYAFHHPTQQYHTFQIPHHPVPLYSSVDMYQQDPKPPSPELTPSSESPTFDAGNKVFVGHLDGQLITQRKLLRRFQHHGHITDIELFKNNLDGSLRLDAFAFVSYLKPEQAQQAINEEDGKEWLGRRLKCCKAHKKREPASESSSPLLYSGDAEIFEDSENVQICLSRPLN